jgi:hypothetical protein
MGLILREKAEYLATFRWLEVFLMETLSGWVPTTPEMEIKILMGRHIWEAAQHADALGERTFELRAPLHYTVKPLSPYLELMKELASIEDTPGRIQAIYDVIVPGFISRYEHYLRNSDSLLDEPSFRVIEGILNSYSRMRREREEVCEELKGTLAFDLARGAKEWSRRESSISDIVAHGSGSTLALGVPA